MLKLTLQIGNKRWGKDNVFYFSERPVLYYDLVIGWQVNSGQIKTLILFQVFNRYSLREKMQLNLPFTS